MKLTIQRADLLPPLALCAAMTDKRTTIPILNNVMLNANGRLEITGTDLNVGAVATANADITTTGCTTVDARRLLATVQALPDVPISLAEKDGWMTLTAAKSRFRLPTIPKDSYPDLPVPDFPAFTVAAAVLAKLIARTRFALSKSDQMAMNTAFVEVNSDSIRMVALDGHRLAVADAQANGTKFRGIFPDYALASLARALKGLDGDLAVHADDNHYRFACGDWSMVARKIVGSFPDYGRMLPKREGAYTTVEVAIRDISEAIKRTQPYGEGREGNCTLLKFSSEGIEVSAQNESGEASEVIAAEVTGKDTSAFFETRYVLEFLDACDADRCRIWFTGKGGFPEFAPSDDESYRYVVGIRRGA